MEDHRRYQRINCTIPVVLTYHDFTYQGRLVNISLKGAMVCANECIMIGMGESCSLSFQLDDHPPLRFDAEVIHTFFSIVGLTLIFDEEQHPRLFEQMVKMSRDQEALKREWERLLEQRRKSKKLSAAG